LENESHLTINHTRKMKINKRGQKIFCGVITAVFFGILAQAADVAGTWTWVTPGRNGGTDRTNTLTLKIDDSKLTGKIAAPRRGGQIAETPITDGKIDGDKVSFAVVREYNGTSNTNKYTGTVSADKITGKMEFTRDGDTQSRDWEAKRSADTK
jgi:hypothetical protein